MIVIQDDVFLFPKPKKFLPQLCVLCLLLSEQALIQIGFQSELLDFLFGFY
jgi:hypothetical protein